MNNFTQKLALLSIAGISITPSIVNSANFHHQTQTNLRQADSNYFSHYELSRIHGDVISIDGSANFLSNKYQWIITTSNIYVKTNKSSSFLEINNELEEKIINVLSNNSSSRFIIDNEGNIVVSFISHYGTMMVHSLTIWSISNWTQEDYLISCAYWNINDMSFSGYTSLITTKHGTYVLISDNKVSQVNKTSSKAGINQNLFLINNWIKNIELTPITAMYSLHYAITFSLISYMQVVGMDISEDGNSLAFIFLNTGLQEKNTLISGAVLNIETNNNPNNFDYLYTSSTHPVYIEYKADSPVQIAQTNKTFEFSKNDNATIFLATKNYGLLVFSLKIHDYQNEILALQDIDNVYDLYLEKDESGAEEVFISGFDNNNKSLCYEYFPRQKDLWGDNNTIKPFIPITKNLPIDYQDDNYAFIWYDAYRQNITFTNMLNVNTTLINYLPDHHVNIVLDGQEQKIENEEYPTNSNISFVNYFIDATSYELFHDDKEIASGNADDLDYQQVNESGNYQLYMLNAKTNVLEEYDFSIAYPGDNMSTSERTILVGGVLGAALILAGAFIIGIVAYNHTKQLKNIKTKKTRK